VAAPAVAGSDERPGVARSLSLAVLGVADEYRIVQATPALSQRID
jgi:hypothetical protein